jgi:hypothetical protein
LADEGDDGEDEEDSVDLLLVEEHVGIVGVDLEPSAVTQGVAAWLHGALTRTPAGRSPTSCSTNCANLGPYRFGTFRSQELMFS